MNCGQADLRDLQNPYEPGICQRARHAWNCTVSWTTIQHYRLCSLRNPRIKFRNLTSPPQSVDVFDSSDAAGEGNSQRGL